MIILTYKFNLIHVVEKIDGDHQMLSISIFVLNDHNGILHYTKGHKSPTITRHLREEGTKVSRV